MSELAKLPNVGKVLESHLLSIGIQTPEQLKQIGSKKAFKMIRMYQDPDACLHMLYGIEGAVEGILDKNLSEQVKNELRAFYKSL